MESFARMMANNAGPDKAANREEATDVGFGSEIISRTEVFHELPSELSRNPPPAHVLSFVRIFVTRRNRCNIGGTERYVLTLRDLHQPWITLVLDRRRRRTKATHFQEHFVFYTNPMCILQGQPSFPLPRICCSEKS